MPLTVSEPDVGYQILNSSGNIFTGIIYFGNNGKQLKIPKIRWTKPTDSDFDHYCCRNCDIEEVKNTLYVTVRHNLSSQMSGATILKNSIVHTSGNVMTTDDNTTIFRKIDEYCITKLPTTHNIAKLLIIAEQQVIVDKLRG